jgi:hypothetical protein
LKNCGIEQPRELNNLKIRGTSGSAMKFGNSAIGQFGNFSIHKTEVGLKGTHPTFWPGLPSTVLDGFSSPFQLYAPGSIM